MYIAHDNQSLENHLQGVANLSRKNAGKIGCGDYGELLGLLHDVGKYSDDFQSYIKSAVGILDPDVDEETVESSKLRGKIDHSTAGAQLLWSRFSSGTNEERLFVQILSLCLVSHHSGIIDCLTTDSQGTYDAFSKRINKSDDKTHIREAQLRLDKGISERLRVLLSKPDFFKPMELVVKGIYAKCPEQSPQSTIFQFQLGLFIRFLFSCLIDADRQDSADSENIKNVEARQNGIYRSWVTLSERLEKALTVFGSATTKVNRIRTEVSEQCLKASQKKKGIFTLTVPTGGGKTLASLRFALHHAELHHLDRIVYIIPFTSIIDQNAEVVRKILEVGKEEKGKIVLEHHSNIGNEKQSWKEKLLTENWDAPVIYTTMVQFLEAFFGGGTRGARRMHQLANSVIIFDEIQTLPIRCVHMFCNAVNFLVDQCGSSVVLCTATQPLLGNVDRLKGALSLSRENEIMSNITRLFSDLERVEVCDCRKIDGWTDNELAELAIREEKESGSCLIVVNTKRSARSLFTVLQEKMALSCFHLSTAMCPMHRKKVLSVIRERIAPEKNIPTICISTQLIEAGIDVDFGSVIRCNAGLDSIAQAAGRCNRNGIRRKGKVYIVNPKEENIDFLKDIAIGKEKSERVLNDFKETPEDYDNDPIGPALLKWYYKNYFFERKGDMSYPVKAKEIGRDDTILDLLSTNELAISEFVRAHHGCPSTLLFQSFMTAGRVFKSIDAPTQSVIVQYGEKGRAIVNQLCAGFNVEEDYKLLHEAQQYSVNLFSNEFERLKEIDALHSVQEGMDIFYLDSKYYSEQFGLSMEAINKEECLNV